MSKTELDECKETREKKEFLCYIYSAEQKDHGKYKKSPTTKFTVMTRGIVDQGVFTDICRGVSNGHVAVITIHYQKKVEKQS